MLLPIPVAEEGGVGRELLLRKLPTGLAARFALALVGLVVSSVAAVTLLMNFGFKLEFSVYARSRSRSQASAIASDLARAYREVGGWERADLSAAVAEAAAAGALIEILDEEGRPLPLPWPAPMLEMHNSMMGGEGREWVVLPVVVEGKEVGRVRLGFPATGLGPEERSFMGSMNLWHVLGGGLAALVAVGLSFVLAGWVARPVREVAGAAGALASGARDVVVREDAPDELGELARAFNRMARAITEEEARRRAFLQEVVHELRTPLQSLRGELEAMADGILNLDREAVASLEEEVSRLARLVEDLDAMARLEAPEFSLRRAPTDLGEVSARVERLLRREFEAKGVELEAALAPSRCHADPDRMAQVVVNLLTNALRHTPPGGRVSICAWEAEARACLQVEDSGPGFPPGEENLLFERFYRGEGGRSGLGLAVVKELVEAHGGRVEAGRGKLGGARITLELPAQARMERPPAPPP